MPDQHLVSKAKSNSIALASFMIDDLKIAGRHLAYQREEKALYSYNGKFYEHFEGIDLDDFFHKFLIQYEVTDIWKSNRLTEIERAMKVNDRVPKVKFDDYDTLMCLRNGILDLKTMELMPHSPEYYFTTMVDVDYEPEAGDAPETFLKALYEIFYIPGVGVDKDMVKMIQQIGGSLIFPKNKLKKMFLFLGEGSNGKSVVINTFKLFFHEENITYLTLEDLSSRTAERAGLLKSRINLSTEAKGSTIDSEEIKKIIYGEGITLRKMFKEPFSFMPKTKIVIASNSRPFFNDTSYGMERRLSIISFHNKFVRPQDYAKMADPDKYGIFKAEDDFVLMEKISAEKPQILNFFLQGLRDLIDNDWQLIDTQNASRTKDDYLRSNDTVGSWLRDNYELGIGEYSMTPVVDILADYRDWYAENVSTRALNYSTMSMGSKIKEVFRLEPKRIMVGPRKLAAYNIVKKYVPNFDETRERQSEAHEEFDRDFRGGQETLPELDS